MIATLQLVLDDFVARPQSMRVMYLLEELAMRLRHGQAELRVGTAVHFGHDSLVVMGVFPNGRPE